LPPKSIELLWVRILRQAPAPEILNREHRRDSRTVTLGSHENSPAARSIVGGMKHPYLRAWFGGVHSAIQRECRQLRPTLAQLPAVGNLEDGILHGFLSNLHPEWPIQSLNARGACKGDRQQLFKPAVLPGTV